jgi:ubiquinone/menaquinone biosynthesis C-methylase UbiE
VYDLSNLYGLEFLPVLSDQKVISIHAGFDEISTALQKRYPHINLINCDIYNPKQHTEASIKRARKAYPQAEDVVKIETNHIPFDKNEIDVCIAFFSLHEIRNQEEREVFFKELYRILKPKAKVYLIEHLRDLPNFMAYSAGFLHFLSKSTWLKTFQSANFELKHHNKHTPFVNVFILQKHDPTS